MSNLATLNALRAQHNKPALKCWKASKAKLAEAIAALSPTESSSRSTEFTTWCRANNMNPKVVRNRLRRHNLTKPASGWTINDKVKEALGL